jgi:glucose-6-phosphate isomerase
MSYLNYISNHPFPEKTAAWAELENHFKRISCIPPSTLAKAPDRFEAFLFRQEGLVVDFSRQRLDLTALKTLVDLAGERRLEEGIHALFKGMPINHTEGRAALHMAMRGGCAAPEEDRAWLASEEAVLATFCTALGKKHLLGSTGKPLTHLIHLGIGGSELGPLMVWEALRAHHVPEAPRVDFVANIDPEAFDRVLQAANPEETLFVLASKSFGTQETLLNAAKAKAWLKAGLGAEHTLAPHWVALTNARDKAKAFGVADDRIFGLPLWVGGRFSLWSAIGLPVRLALGEAGWKALLDGAALMDRHFAQAPLAQNGPVRLALCGLWNTLFMQRPTLAILPYCERLRRLPAFLQQLEMESNGKRLRHDKTLSPLPTAPVVWGGTGTNGQHAFHQLFYQGNAVTALDFVAVLEKEDPLQEALLANALAQAQALMHGSGPGIPHDDPRFCAGGTPSSFILLDTLSPRRIGQLLALYEHKVFSQGWILGINSFDQFGVELGKEMARTQADGQGDGLMKGLKACMAELRAQADIFGNNAIE